MWPGEQKFGSLDAPGLMTLDYDLLKVLDFLAMFEHEGALDWQED